MREIEFRGIARYGVDFIYGSLLIETNEAGRVEYFIKRDTSKIEVKVETVGQYIGVKDKNKIKIYEGDKVVCKSYPFYGNAPEITSSDGMCDELNYIGVVIWDDTNTGYFLDMNKVSARVSGAAVGMGIMEYEHLGIEVIGNIHQNKELLDGDENESTSKI